MGFLQQNNYTDNRIDSCKFCIHSDNQVIIYGKGIHCKLAHRVVANNGLCDKFKSE